MDFPYVFVDEKQNPAEIVIRVGSELLNREGSGCIKADAVATGKFLAKIGVIHWLYSSSIDNYPHDVEEEDPDYCLRELINEGYAS